MGSDEKKKKHLFFFYEIFAFSLTWEPNFQNAIPTNEIAAESFEISPELFSHWSSQNYGIFEILSFRLFWEFCAYFWPICSECDYMIWPQWPWKVNVKVTQILKASIS